jgi:hypothetical protein
MRTEIDSHKTNEVLQRDPRWHVVERIAASPHLKASFRLQEFLFYIAECAIREVPGDATEQQIGIHVFHRNPGYNSSEDSIVRTHARLLRQKLAAYFANEGAHEEIIVDVPKGHYLPVFIVRSEQVHSATAPLDESPIPPLQPAPQVHHEEPSPAITPVVTSQLPGPRILAAFLLLLTVLALITFHPWRRARVTQTPVAQSPVDIFWRPFFLDDPPFVVYSNALFTGNSISGLRYAPPGGSEDQSSKDSYVDTYTGIGELSAVYDLTRLFDSHQATFTLKRSQLVAWDEAKSRNLIFIGASVENPSLRVLPPTVNFTQQAGVGFAGIVNHHPKPGEPAMYARPEHPLTTDYAIIALLPGVQSGKRVLLFSGLTTFGTQAAVEFLCRPDSVAEILKQVTGPKGEIRPFEAVIQTTVGGGVALETHLVTLRID